MAADRSTGAPCPLCTAAATIVDWRPQVAWVSVDGCPCGGFSVSPEALGQIAALPPEDRGRLRTQLAELRASGRDAWLTMGSNLSDGRVEVLAERPSQR